MDIVRKFVLNLEAALFRSLGLCYTIFQVFIGTAFVISCA